MSKETYYSVKRDLLQCRKRPITVSKVPPPRTETETEIRREIRREIRGEIKREMSVSRDVFISRCLSLSRPAAGEEARGRVSGLVFRV